MSQAEPYHYVRFVWWRTHTAEELVESLTGDFTLFFRSYEDERYFKYDFSPLKGLRWEILLEPTPSPPFSHPLGQSCSRG